MEQEPTLTEAVSRSNDIGPIPTARLATHTTSDDRVKDEAVQWWREPNYLTYSSYSARARSYFNWPKQLQKPAPDALSKAGFFYTGTCIFNSFTLCPIHIFLLYGTLLLFFLHLSTGIGDKTICFHCGGSLDDWGCEDHPFSKHAALFPHCVYVTYMRSLGERQLE
jgi:hypothetical protein